MATDYIQTNVNLSEEDTSKLITMMQQLGFDNRSAFIRYLIRQEYARRTQINTEHNPAAVDEKQFAAKTQADCSQTAK